VISILRSSHSVAHQPRLEEFTGNVTTMSLLLTDRDDISRPTSCVYCWYEELTWSGLCFTAVTRTEACHLVDLIKPLTDPPSCHSSDINASPHVAVLRWKWRQKMTGRKSYATFI